MCSNDQNKISFFSDSVVNSIAPPERFTFPFYYEPHPLTKIAAGELQDYLEKQTDLQHNFGLTNDSEDMVIGKMFGVLVVADGEGKIGYLSAFSGKLAGTNDHPKFVPPVFDMLTEDSFFLKEQDVIDAINRQIEEAQIDEGYLRLKQDLEELTEQSSEDISVLRGQLKDNNHIRKALREEKRKSLDMNGYALLEAELVKQSLYDKHLLKVQVSKWTLVLEVICTKLEPLDASIEALKEER